MSAVRERKVYAGAAAQFDERRNSSRVFPVPPDALPDALRTLQRAERVEPDWRTWVVAYGRQEHAHGLFMLDGKTRAACPVRGCAA